MRLTIKLRFKDGSEKTIPLPEGVIAFGVTAADDGVPVKAAPQKTMADQFDAHVQDLHTEVRPAPDPHVPQAPGIKTFLDEPEGGGRH